MNTPQGYGWGMRPLGTRGSVRWGVSAIGRSTYRSLALIAALGMVGCSGTPLAPLRTPASLAGAPPVTVTAEAWPKSDWWTDYGDAQLNALVEEGLRSSPTFAVALQRIRAADALTAQSGAALAPAVTANAGVNEQKQSYNNGIPAFIVPKGYNDGGRATLDLNWDIDLWGKNIALVRAAQAEADATRADAEAAKLALATSIALAYADLIRGFSDLETARQSADLRRQTAALAEERRRLGLDTRTNARQADQVRRLAGADSASVEENLALTRHRIALLLGAPPARGDRIVKPAAPKLGRPDAPLTLGLDLLGRRPDIVAARLRAQEAAERVHAAHADFYPSVNLAAFVGVQSLTLDTLTKSGSDIGSVNPAVHLPIFNAGRIRSAYQAAEAQYAQAAASYEGVVAAALQDVADTLASRQALAERLAQTAAAARAAEDARDLTRTRVELGLSSKLALLTAEDQAINARHGVQVLEARAFTLDVSLIRALGGGYRADGN